MALYFGSSKANSVIQVITHYDDTVTNAGSRSEEHTSELQSH